MRVDRVLVTSTVPDALNTNKAIRKYVATGFVDVLGQDAVLQSAYEAAPQVIGDNTPDLVLAVGGCGVDAASLNEIRRAADRAGARLALWVHDDPYEFDYADRATAVADIIFTSDAWAKVHYRFDRVHHLPLAGCKRTHFREIREDDPISVLLFFCGVGYPNRVAFLRQCKPVLEVYPVEIYGAHWPHDLPMAVNRRLTVDEMADKARNALLTLNIGRTLNIANRRYNLPASTPGPRTFEVALSGSAQVHFVDGLEIADYFDPDSEIVLFDAVSDLRRILEHAREEPEHYARIARAAQARALRDHTYSRRAETVIARVSDL
jgi:spore maturation protein CgeB